MSLWDEVARHVKLDRRGFGICPFPGHKEKTGSLHVFRATKGKHKGEWLYYCHGCHEKGDAGDWQFFITGRRGEIEREDPEVRRIRLGDEKVAAERARLLLRFRNRYPDTPEEAIDFLDTVQERLQAARQGVR